MPRQPDPLPVGGPIDHSAHETARLTGRFRSSDGLTTVAFVYLAIPNLIFIFGWFRLPVAFVLLAAMCVLLLKVLARGPFGFGLEHSTRAVIFIALAAVVWAAFGGGSHFVHANHDWIIRDAVLGDLVRADWPVTYKAQDGSVLTLRSAIGYFLPPALFGKAFGTAHLDIAVHLWTAAGILIFLLMLPLPRQGGWRLALALTTVVFFSGMDFLGIVIATQSTPIFPLRLEWWGPLSYPSLTGQLLWAPNHCLPIWIGTLLLFRHRHADAMPRIAIALLPITLIWTPFAAIGLAPFAVLGAWHSLRQGGWRGFPWDSAIAGLIFTIPFALYLLADIGSITSTSPIAAPAIPVASVAHQPVSMTSYLIFVSCEFLLLAMAIAAHVRQARGYFALSVLVLLLLPALNFGPSNDLLLRLSTPPLVVLLAVCLQTLTPPVARPYPATLWIAWLFLAIGGHTAFNELWRAATFQRWSADYRVSLAERQGGRPGPHYAGNMRASLGGKLLKPATN
jgi:hypothetical protein